MNVGEVVKVVEHFAMERESEIGELREQVATLTRERDEWKEACDAIGADDEAATNETAARIDLLLRERDAARELCRRFRGLFCEQLFIDDSVGAGSQWAIVCRDYDARFSDTPAPAEDATGELVPWTAETRPRGVIILRACGQTVAEFVPGWMGSGEVSDGSQIGWQELLEDYEWSRDGITWKRCGTVRETGVK